MNKEKAKLCECGCGNYAKPGDCGCDGTECRLVPLCKSCHSKTTSGDREMWEELIMDMLEKCE